MDKLYIIVPAYNEQDNIERFVDDWYGHNRLSDESSVITSDGSKDNTYELLLKSAINRKLPPQKPCGEHQAATSFSYRYAVKTVRTTYSRLIPTGRPTE